MALAIMSYTRHVDYDKLLHSLYMPYKHIALTEAIPHHMNILKKHVRWLWSFFLITVDAKVYVANHFYMCHILSMIIHVISLTVRAETGDLVKNLELYTKLR